MKKRFMSRVGLLLIVVALITPTVRAQVTTTGRLAGTVTDAQGAVVPNAEVIAKNDQTQAEYKVRANDEGGWSIPSVPNGVYTITITAAGFKSTVIQNVKVDTGTVSSVNAALEVGGATEQVIVTGGGSVIQSESATIASTIVGRQIGELPWATRDAMQLVLTLPGVQTPGAPRTSSVNGLPKAALNITLDGANIQDNFLKSSDGFFTSTQAKSDAVEEVTVSTAAPGAESAGAGAVQIRFVTKSGSNDWRGGLFWQHRNTALNSNYYFNNIDGLPRDFMILNQAGGNIGGPIIIPKVFNGRDKAFFFVNYEEFRLPQTYPSPTRTVLTDTARTGIYTYKDSIGNLRQVNLYQIAAARNFPSTPDPTIATALGLISEAAQKGVLTDRISTNNDYNRLALNFQDPGRNIRRFPTLRLDFNINKDHHLEFVHNYQHYFSDPDGVNGQLNVYPGTGIVVGSPGVTGSIYRNNFTFAMAERWTITNRLVNEVRLTSSGNGTSVFTREFSPDLFKLYDGFVLFQATAYTSAFQSRSSASRRNTPVKGISDNINWLKGTHAMNYGVEFTQINSFSQSVSRHTVPSITLGIASGDPVNTGSTNIFSTTNFPGSTAAQRTEAALLYALLTGRVSSTSRIATFDPEANDFQFVPTDEFNHQRQFGLYAQDSWKMKPNFTLTYGLRWEFQPSPINDNKVYTRNDIEGVFGVSGVGNLFQPGVFEGVVPQYRLFEDGERAYKTRYTDIAPTLGFAWTPNGGKGILGSLFGDSGQTVLRGGYAMAFVREGFNAFNTMFGFNEVPSITLGLDPTNNPTEFGAPGSVLFRNRDSLPFRPVPTPTFPFTARAGQSINDFDPNIEAPYVQSWSFGIQRELDRNTAFEIRYVGNHATKLWRQYELSEVNIFENGFLDEFLVARENLRIARAANASSNNFGNQNLPGQRPVPIITAALANATNDLNFATLLTRGEAGTFARNIATSFTRMNRLINANLVPFVTLPDPNNPGAQIRLSNFFYVNPTSPENAFIMTNGADSTYNALQLELRRRMSSGFLVQGSYVWSKSLTNFFASSSSVFSQPTTLRDLGYDKGPAPRDNRHALKVDWIHELPIGPGRRFLNDRIPVFGKLLEGWQWGGVARIQSGTPFLLTSGRNTFNHNGNRTDSGVILHGIDREQLQAMVKIRKETICDPVTGKCQGVVFYLPRSIIENSQASFEVGGKTLNDLNTSRPYIGPPTEPGQLGQRIFLYGPWTSRFDLNVMKRTKISETTNFEFRVQFLNAFNRPNFTVQDPDTNAATIAVNSSAFGQTRNAYRDFTVSGTNDPGGRLIEFQLRLNF